MTKALLSSVLSPSFMSVFFILVQKHQQIANIIMNDRINTPRMPITMPVTFPGRNLLVGTTTVDVGVVNIVCIAGTFVPREDEVTATVAPLPTVMVFDKDDKDDVDAELAVTDVDLATDVTTVVLKPTSMVFDKDDAGAELAVTGVDMTTDISDAMIEPDSVVLALQSSDDLTDIEADSTGPTDEVLGPEHGHIAVDGNGVTSLVDEKLSVDIAFVEFCVKDGCTAYRSTVKNSE